MEACFKQWKFHEIGALFSFFLIDAFDVEMSTFFFLFPMWTPEARDEEWPDLNSDSSTW